MNIDVMADFLYKLAWVTGCPDVGLNITLSVSVRTFLGGVDI